MANTMNIGDRWVRALTSLEKQVRYACKLAGPDETHPRILNEVVQAVPAAARWQGGRMRFQKMGRDNYSHGF